MDIEKITLRFLPTFENFYIDEIDAFCGNNEYEFTGVTNTGLCVCLNRQDNLYRIFEPDTTIYIRYM